MAEQLVRCERDLRTLASRLLADQLRGRQSYVELLHFFHRLRLTLEREQTVFGDDWRLLLLLELLIRDSDARRLDVDVLVREKKSGALVK